LILQLQVAYAKGLLKGKTAVESEAKKSLINNVVSALSALHQILSGEFYMPFYICVIPVSNALSCYLMCI